MVCAKFGAG
jgi:regulator of protease activity HflC (stomatin/prohibitin superfamily)